jgi:hypothetical protein
MQNSLNREAETRSRLLPDRKKDGPADKATEKESEGGEKPALSIYV